MHNMKEKEKFKKLYDLVNEYNRNYSFSVNYNNEGSVLSIDILDGNSDAVCHVHSNGVAIVAGIRNPNNEMSIEILNFIATEILGN